LTPRDETRNAVTLELLDALAGVLSTLTTRQANIINMRFGLVDDVVQNYKIIGLLHKMSSGRVRRIESETISRIRHPSRGQLFDKFTSGFSSIPVHIREKVLGPIVLPNLLQCEKHGWTDPATMLVFPTWVCDQCPCPIPGRPEPGVLSGPPARGRPRRYCSNMCRQTAYRQRRKAEQ